MEWWWVRGYFHSCGQVHWYFGTAGSPGPALLERRRTILVVLARTDGAAPTQPKVPLSSPCSVSTNRRYETLYSSRWTPSTEANQAEAKRSVELVEAANASPKRLIQSQAADMFSIGVDRRWQLRL